VIFGTEQKNSLGISKTHVGVEEETQAANQETRGMG